MVLEIRLGSHFRLRSHFSDLSVNFGSQWLPAPNSYCPRHTLSYAKAPKLTRCEIIETTIRKRRLFFAGGVTRQSKERFPSRVMFWTMIGGKNPRPGGQLNPFRAAVLFWGQTSQIPSSSSPKRDCGSKGVNTWHIYIVEDLREFRATEGSTEVAPLSFGVETALWSTTAKNTGKWYGEVLETAERFMVRWHEGEAKPGRQRRASAVGGAQGNGGRRENSKRSGR